MITDFKIFEVQENRIDTTPLSKDEANNIIKENCKDFNRNDKQIFRGIYLPKQPYLIDPKKHHRLSANADNYYNMLIDNSVLWKDYPKRKHSLIGTFAKFQAIPYGTIFRVIPFDGSKFGVVPHGEDMWQSFNYLYLKTGVAELNYVDVLIDDFNQALFEQKLNNLVYNIFTNQLTKMENEIRKNYNVSLNKISKYYGDYFRPGKEYYKKFFYYISEQIVMKNKSLLSVLEDLLSPTKNGFQNLDYKSLLKREGKGADSVPEVWTDSKCILIPEFDLDFEISGNLHGFKI